MTQLSFKEEFNEFAKNPRFHTEKLGKVMKEAYLEKVFQNEDAKNKLLETLEMPLDTKKEELTFDGNTGFYAIVPASFIEAKLRPTLLAAEVVKKITVDPKGVNGTKINVRSALITAADLPDSGAVSYDAGDYDPSTITLKWVYGANTITFELLQHSRVDLMSEELGEIGSALARKMDTDIIAAIDSVCTSGNSNLTNLGATTTITYDLLVNGIASAMGNYAMPDVLLTNPNSWARLMKDTTFKQAQVFGSSANNSMPPLVFGLNLKFLVSQQVGANNIYLIDSKKTGYLAEIPGIVTFDGRVNASTKFEIIGVKGYGVTIVQPKSVYKLKENTAA